MRGLRAFVWRVIGSFQKGRRDRTLAEEFESHLAMQIDDFVRAGMAPGEARRLALVQSGGLESAKEACRDRGGLPVLDAAGRDLRHTLRLLGRSPAFTTVAVLSLALGIGANTAIFTLLDQLTLRPLPVEDPSQLQMIWTTGPHLGSNQGDRAVSYPMCQDFQQRGSVFTHVFCRAFAPVSISVGNRTERVTGELVSGNYFRALGVGPALGRVFSPEEDDRVYKGHPVVVLSHPYWVARFGADPSVIGQKILVNNDPMVIVGVSAAGFSGVDPVQSPQIRIPIQMKPLVTPGSDRLGDRRTQWVQVFARRKSGQTLQSAEAALQPLLNQILLSELDSPALRDTTQGDRDRFLARKVRSASIANGYSSIPKSYSRALVVLMGLVGLVLLIACFNVASLLISRAAARQKELATRLAIGASRGQLSRQLLMESAVLSMAGGALGLLVAVMVVRGLLTFLPGNGMLATLSAEPDWRILAFTGAVSLATVLLFGLAPTRQAVKVDLSRILNDGTGSVGGNRGSARLRKNLVTAQITFSFLLVVGAMLFARTLVNLKGVNSGFHSIDTLVTFQVDPARNGYSLPQMQAFHRQLLERVRALPGVSSAGYAWVPVLCGYEADWTITVDGHSPDNGGKQALVNGISPGYWRTMGMSLLQGRDFDDSDVSGAPRVAIVNREFARHLFGDESPLGHRFTVSRDPRARPDVEIVGVVEDSLYEGPWEGLRRQVFFPFPQMNQRLAATFYVRASADSAGLSATLRRTAQQLDPTVPVYEQKTLEEQLDETLGTERLIATLSVAFGLLATLLAAIGLYGVMDLAVQRRTREIGLRLAVGANRTAVVWLVGREALVLLGVGLAVAIPCAYAISRYVASQLFGVSATDVGTVASAAVVLVVVTTAASLLPAWRAARLDPVRALRQG